MGRSAFLKDRIANAKRNLALPNEPYANGRMSHDVEREVLAESESELRDLMLDGYFDASGSFVGFSDEVFA